MRFVNHGPASVLVLLVVFAGGCLTDSFAPAPPLLDAVPARTSLPALPVSGVAEYNATLTISGGAEAVTTTADGFSGRFAVDVPLADGDNALRIVATDAVGNTSGAATVDIVREPARAEGVRVTLPRTVINADDGTIEVVVDVTNDEAAVARSSLGVTLSIPEDVTFAPVPVVVNDSGRAVVVLAERRAQGTFTLRVEADVADSDGNKAFDQASFTVVPGRPVEVDVALSATVDGSPIAPANTITVPAATTVDVDVVVTDAHGNAIPDPRIAIDVPGANATILGDRIVNLTRAGAFDVVADTGIALVAGTATLTVTAADADHVLLATSDVLVQAGTAVRAVARVVDRFDNVVADTVPDIVIDAPQPFGVPVVDAGIATATATVTTAGTYTITASDPASGATPASEPLQVVAAAAVNANFIEIDATGLPYSAGAPVRVNYGFVDAFGNANASTPLVVTVNAPNVVVVDNGAGVVEIYGIVRAGTYVIRGHAVGAGLVDDLETLVVDPNPQLAGFNLVMSTALTAQFGTVVFNGADGFGNLIDEADITTTFSDASVTRTGSVLTFGRAGSFSVTACITGTTLCDTEFISVQGLLDTVPPAATVTVQSPVAGSTVVRGQRIVFGVVVTDDRALSSLSFVATFGSNGACRTTGGPLLFAGTTSESRTFSFTVPTCAIPLDDVSIVAQASDQAGNTSNTANETLTVADPFNLSITPDGAGGAFVTRLVAFQDRLDGPAGVDVDPISGTIFVGNSGLQDNRTDRAVGVTLDRVQFDLTDQTGNRIDLRDVRGVAANAAGTLFFGVAEVGSDGGGSSGIVRVTRDLQRQTFVNSSTPGGQSEAITQAQFVVNQLALDESSGLPTALCMVIQQQDHVWCYGNVDGAAQRLAEVELNGLRPRGIAIDPPSARRATDLLWVALDGNTRVVRPFVFNATRTTLSAVTGGDVDISDFVDGNTQLGDLAVAPSGNLYLAHRADGRILKIDPTTRTVSVFVDNLTSPTGLAFDGATLLVTDDEDRVVFRIVPDPLNPGTF
jgi:hypothetical protein